MLVGVDPVSGEKIEGDLDPMEAAKCIHLSIYQRRPDAKAIMHVHPTYGTVLSMYSKF